MPKVLEKLTLYMEEAAAFRSTIIGALIYPAVMFTVCLLAVIVFAVVIGPTFEKIFKDLGTEMPALTVAVMAFFKIIQTKSWLIILCGVGGFFLLKNRISTASGKRAFEKFLFGLPVFGGVFKLIVVEKFTGQMAILIDSGVPILFALEITEKLVENETCSDVIKKVGAGVREGRYIADMLEESSFFPTMAVQMIRVGEETGELGQMMNHVAVFYKKQAHDFMKALGTLIEPVMLVVMGGIIGTLVVAMFLPILSLSTGG
jgi:type IV pilus assembly protein PilC